MAKLNTLPLAPWIRYFSAFTERSLERMQETIEAIEEETYTPTKFMSDGVRLWLDVTVGWWNAMQASTLTPTPIVFLRMLTDGEAASTEPLPVTISEKTDLKKTELVRLGDAGVAAKAVGERPVAEKLHVRMGEKPGCLSVTYRHVPPPKKGERRMEPPPLAPGLYQSLVHANNKLVAIVQFLVE